MRFRLPWTAAQATLQALVIVCANLQPSWGRAVYNYDAVNIPMVAVIASAFLAGVMLQPRLPLPPSWAPIVIGTLLASGAVAMLGFALVALTSWFQWPELALGFTVWVVAPAVHLVVGFAVSDQTLTASIAIASTVVSTLVAPFLLYNLFPSLAGDLDAPILLWRLATVVLLPLLVGCVVKLVPFVDRLLTRLNTLLFVLQLVRV